MNSGGNARNCSRSGENTNEPLPPEVFKRTVGLPRRCLSAGFAQGGIELDENVIRLGVLIVAGPAGFFGKGFGLGERFTFVTNETEVPPLFRETFFILHGGFDSNQAVLIV